ADLVEQPPAPGGAALEHERGVELVRAIVDPLAQSLATGFAERLVEQRTVFENDHIPAEGLEQRLIARPQAFADHGVEALAIVVDDPPAIAQALFPTFEDGLEDIAFVELGIADQRNHATFGSLQAP